MTLTLAPATVIGAATAAPSAVIRVPHGIAVEIDGASPSASSPTWRSTSAAAAITSARAQVLVMEPDEHECCR